MGKFIVMWVFNLDACWLCNNGLTCVPVSQVCDGSNDCDDSSDESVCSGVGNGPLEIWKRPAAFPIFELL